jgi:SAM-dependent methyltransferase
MTPMPRYALLLAPSANRVYAAEATRLAAVELAAFAPVLTSGLAEVAVTRIGGADYVTFAAGLTPRDVAFLSNLSAAYALFERVGDGLLRPLELAPLARYDSDLVTIPKYAGKTNEQFTKLLLNLTVLASAAAPRMLDGRLTVCDPLCGRGTTLNQALMYGYDAVGVELDAHEVDAYAAFLKAYLRRKRLKHSAEVVPVRREGRRVARRLDVTLAASKQEHAAGAVQKVVVLHADTTRLAGLLRPACADVLVADAPYGVAHGSQAAGGLSRSPLDLLESAVPQWVPLLRPGGALGLSFNTRVARRERCVEILRANGLAVVLHGDLAHRVDQAIERDVVIARKPD